MIQLKMQHRPEPKSRAARVAGVAVAFGVGVSGPGSAQQADGWGARVQRAHPSHADVRTGSLSRTINLSRKGSEVPAARRAPSREAVVVAEEQTSQPADAENAQRPAPGTAAPERAAEADTYADANKSEGSSGASLADQYCRVVSDLAFAAKLSEEKRRADELRRQIEKKIEELEIATAEQKKWLQLRKEFQNKATENLVAVYAFMDAEAAAQRLTDVADDVAAAILIKLPPKSASAIFAEMQSDKAGRLTAYLAGSAAIAQAIPEGEGATR